jgi:2-keto-4-pentenoate hydratase
VEQIMNATRHSVAALLRSRAQGELDPAFPVPRTLREALELQLAVLAELVSRGERLLGWKAAFATGQRPGGLGPDDIAFGFLLERGLLHDGATLARRPLRNCLVEAEVCLVVGDLPGPITSRQQARQAVRALVPALEINQLRCDGAPLHTVVADGLAHYAIVAGRQAAASAGPFGAATLAKRRTASSTLVSAAAGAVTDPYLALARLSAALARFGLSVEPGQYILTGNLVRDAPGPAESCGYFAAIDQVGTVGVALTASDECGATA